MSIWGKIVGGAAGFALGGPLGALLGAAAGHAVDRMALSASGEPSSEEAPDNTKKIAFTIGVIVLGAKMAKADGVVTQDEVAAFKRVFRVPAEETDNVARVFNMARKDARGFEPYARQIAGMFRDRRAVLEELLECLFHIARADGTLHPKELDYLRRVAGIFGFSEAEFESLRAAEAGPDKADPYRILGVDRQADDETVRAAYRRLSRENHPDALIAQGMPQEFVDVANSRMAAINAAYDRIKQERGLR
jgi:DnaJ like chaperone protein